MPTTRNSAEEPGEIAAKVTLAASIHAHGVLQPILVTPVGDRYQVIFGNRRIKAAGRAGLTRTHAIVWKQVDEANRFICNLVENIQRVDLTPKEKASAIQRLAGTGYGVRELSRATGLQASTISRLTRIARKPAVMEAVEAGSLPLFKAMQLASINDPERLADLIRLAPQVTDTEFSRLVRCVESAKSLYSDHDERLAEVIRKLANVRAVSPTGARHLRQIIALATALLEQYALSNAREDLPTDLNVT